MRFRVPVILALAIGVASCGGSGVDFVASDTGTLDTGDNYANNRYYEVWTFRADQSGTATFGMNSPDFQPHLEIEDENFDVIADNDHSGGQADTEISAFLQRDRTYYVIATSALQNETGNYELLWGDSVSLIGANRAAKAAGIKWNPKSSKTPVQSSSQ
jgi:hypothetical protein